MRKPKKNLTSLFLSTTRNNFIFFKRMIKNFELVEIIEIMKKNKNAISRKSKIF